MGQSGKLQKAEILSLSTRAPAVRTSHNSFINTRNKVVAQRVFKQLLRTIESRYTVRPLKWGSAREEKIRASAVQFVATQKATELWLKPRQQERTFPAKTELSG